MASILSDLQRKLLAQLPGFIHKQQSSGDMGGYIEGQGNDRLSRANLYALPDDQYKQAAKQFGSGSEQGMTLNATSGPLDYVLNLLGLHASPIARSASHGPTIVVPQSTAQAATTGDINAQDTMKHEAVHALLHKVDSKANTIAVQDMISPESLVALSRYYNPQEISQEFPARAITRNAGPNTPSAANGPASLGLNTTSGNALALKYINEQIRPNDAQKADRLIQYYKLAQLPQGQRDDTQSFQKPNDTF